MPEPVVSVPVRKFVIEGENPEYLSEKLSVEVAHDCSFTATDAAFHYRGEYVIVGDLWIVAATTQTGYILKRGEISPGRFAIHVIESGSCEVSTDGGQFTLEGGYAHLSRAKRLYEKRVQPGTVQIIISAPIVRYARQVSIAGDDPVRHLPSLETVVPISHPAAKVIGDIGRILLATGEEHTPFEFTPRSAVLLKNAVFETLVSDWPRRDHTNSDMPAGTHNVFPRQLRRALTWIHAHLGSKITLQEIANAADASPRTLQALFAKNLAMSPIQYIIRTRIMQVRQELMDIDNKASIACIAAKYGYPSHGEFEKHYKKIYGQTPSETRRLAKVMNGAID